MTAAAVRAVARRLLAKVRPRVKLPGAMGYIYREVKVCGVRQDGKRATCRTFTALLDPGSTGAVVRRTVAEKTKGVVVPQSTTVEGRQYDTMMARIKMTERGCGVQRTPIVVGDELVDRAGLTPDGKSVDVILGHGYMQETRMLILLSTRRSDEGVACRGRFPKRKR